jgi:hypothetical protein
MIIVHWPFDFGECVILGCLLALLVYTLYTEGSK